MSRPAPRRPASSRGATPRPRKIAGQVVGSNAAEVDTVEDVDLEAPASIRVDGDTDAKADPASTGPARPGPLSRVKTTRVLLATLVLVALALGLEAAMLTVGRVSGDDEPAGAEASKGVSVPRGRPVIANDVDVKAGVDAAAKAAQEIVAVDYQKYAEEVDKAADLMTTKFEEEYRRTAGDIEKDFVANKTIVQANVVAQGVVRANLTRLQALVFLNQAVVRERDGKKETVVTPYKVLVTMVHTGKGWIVDGLETDATQDKTN